MKKWKDNKVVVDDQAICNGKNRTKDRQRKTTEYNY